jgi:hypothetical protein
MMPRLGPMRRARMPFGRYFAKNLIYMAVIFILPVNLLIGGLFIYQNHVMYDQLVLEGKRDLSRLRGQCDGLLIDAQKRNIEMSNDYTGGDWTKVIGLNIQAVGRPTPMQYAIHIHDKDENAHFDTGIGVDGRGKVGVDLSGKYDVGLHMHLVETAYQKEYARRRTGTTALRHLRDLGLLGPRMTLGHGVWLTEDDIELAAGTATMICHNASSNLRLRSGVAPLNRFQARGVRVGLGLDESGINDDRDMFQEMRLACMLPKHRAGVKAVGAQKIVELATLGGADALGSGRDVGSVEVGK